MGYLAVREDWAEFRANLLFEKICDELDPQHFTVAEILEEGFDTVLYARLSDALRNKESFCLGKVNRALDCLVAMGLIEECEDGESYFCIVNDY